MGTIGDLLERLGATSPDSVAIASPSRQSLTYGGLWRHIQGVKTFLSDQGIGRGDRVAIILPDGPEMATAVLGVSSCAASAPLNPAYQRREFEFYLSDVGARALIVPEGADSSAIAIARDRGLDVIRLSSDLSAPAGIFSLRTETAPSPGKAELLRTGDITLVLHTSGTTGHPKLVPLTQANLLTSAKNIATSLNLSSSDRCLNVMPLFHVHGLIGGLLSSISVGGTTICVPGFDATRFFDWLQAFQPTWFTAVPAMHQAVLARLRSSESPTGRSSALKFIRSCSSPLPPAVMSQMEEAFGVPIVEAYGMTEAAHQIAINPLPPLERKPGSVGKPTGQEISIVDETGRRLGPGVNGEVLVRGPNVVRYFGNGDGQQSLDDAGWLHTGDLGFLDNDSYLFLRGRIGEIINRGGEKISPREVEDVLFQHPAIQEAAVFPLPDENLGQVVGAAAVLRPNCDPSTRDIQQFLSTKLAYFKVPRSIVFVDEIPRAATGKVKRASLAERFGTTEASKPSDERLATSDIPTTPTEELIAQIWCELLGIKSVGMHENFFFDLGGDSLLVTEMIVRIEKATGVRLSAASVVSTPTVSSLASWLDSPGGTSAIVPLQQKGPGTPLFCVHGLTGDLYLFFGLAAQIAQYRPVYGLQSATDGTRPELPSLEAMARRYLEEIRSVQPRGPYFLAGHSSGGTIALEIAQQLQADGEKVMLVAMFDSMFPGYIRSLPTRSWLQRVPVHLGRLLRLRIKEMWPYVKNRASTIQTRIETRLWRRRFKAHLAAGREIPESLANITEIHRQMVDVHRPKPYDGSVVLFRSQERRIEKDLAWDLGWSRSVRGEIRIYETPGDHISMLMRPAVSTVAEQLEACYSEALNAQESATGISSASSTDLTRATM